MDHQRASDDVIHEVKLLIESESKRNKEWQEKHDTDALAFRTEIIARIRPFEEFSNGLSMFWKILLAVSALMMSLIKGWAWIRDHVR